MMQERLLSPKQKLQNLSEALSQDPCQSKILLQRSQALNVLGCPEEAIIDITKAIYLEKSIVSYVLRANLYAEVGRFENAVDDFGSAVEGVRERIKAPQKSTASIQINQKINDQKGKNTQPKNTSIVIIIDNVNITQQTKSDSYSCKQSYLDSYNYSSQQISAQMSDFLAYSVTATHLAELKHISHQYQLAKFGLPQPTKKQIQYLFKNLLTYNEGEKQQKESLIAQQLTNFQKLLEMQNQMLAVQHKQIQQLSHKLKYVNVNYEKVFEEQIEMAVMSDKNKQKCVVYFRTICSEMERYYLGAKILQEFHSQKVSFADLEGKAISKGAEVVRMVFKAIDNYSEKMQRAEEVIRQLPMLGTLFKVIKTASKGLQWLNEINQKNQCRNIAQMAATVSTFNQKSTRLAYHLYKHYRMLITNVGGGDEHYRYSQWQKAKRQYSQIKKNGIAGVFFGTKRVEEEWKVVKEVGQVHAAIIMVGIGYGKFTPYTKNHKTIHQQSPQGNQKNQNKTLNQEEQLEENQNSLNEIYKTIDQVEERLRIKQEMMNTMSEQIAQKAWCSIY